MQFSPAIGGGGFIPEGETDLTGHRMSLICTPNYKKVDGLGKFRSEHGGYGWGRVYPNSYLLSLYDQQKDTRYEGYFKHEWYYLDKDLLPEEKNLGDVATTTTALYLECLHPCTLKYFDRWTNADLPSRRSSFKDIIIYRLAETYLIAAEAYFYKEGGSSTKAIQYYNETWQRAGNDRFNGPLTLDILVDEYARELNFEGVRWPLLKRLGLLEERVKLHAGDKVADDPRLNKDYIEARENFQSYHWYWPIPQSEIDQMGKENFPQNEGY
ncbi:MAG: RagB/SusD family nutrient uptake outer membrane protein [Bacteroides sp.]|nr:RagB/SusD family nutrient uptake outer membrane protein [Bacteroides sp.]